MGFYNNTTQINQEECIGDSLETINQNFTNLDGAISSLYNVTTALNIAGTVRMWAGSEDPAGWFICDGRSVNRETYSELFNVVGVTYGHGNGATTFNIPNLIGRTVVGAGVDGDLSTRTLGASGGAETHALSRDEMPAHTHRISTKIRVTKAHPKSKLKTTKLAPEQNNRYPEDWQDTGNLETVGGGASGDMPEGNGFAHNNMQPFLVMNYIIKY